MHIPHHVRIKTWLELSVPPTSAEWNENCVFSADLKARVVWNGAKRRVSLPGGGGRAVWCSSAQNDIAAKTFFYREWCVRMTTQGSKNII